MASTEKLEKYKLLYSRYIDFAVNLHNYHLNFIRNPSFEGGLRERKQIRNMIKIEQEMIKLSREVFLEKKNNLKEEKLIAKEKKLKRKKRNEPNYNTNENLI